MGADRVDVQLDEVDLDGADPAADGAGATGADPVGARRTAVLRVVRRWWPVPVVAVGAVVGWQAVGETRAEQAAEQLRGVDGVLHRTVQPPLDARAWPGLRPGLALAIAPSTVDGTLVLPWVADDGAWDVVAVDAADGTEVWRTRVADEPMAGGATQVSCLPDAAPARVLSCTVLTDGPDDAGTGGTTSRLVRVDAAAGTVQTVRDLPPDGAGVVLGDAVVLVRPDGDGLEVTSTGTDPGAPVAWRTVVPDGVAVDGGTWPWVQAVGDQVWVGGGRLMWALDPRTGEVEASGSTLSPGRQDRVVVDAGGSGTRILGPDGTAVDTLGAPERVRPDDGSEPGLELLRRYDGSSTTGLLRAVDTTTGETAWERPLGVEAGSNLVVLRGVVYGADLGTVWALDLATGRERWSTAGDTGAHAPLLTDGRALLRTERDARGGPVLAAYGLDDGRRLWETPLPDGVEAVRESAGALVGQGGDSVSSIG